MCVCVCINEDLLGWCTHSAGAGGQSVCRRRCCPNTWLLLHWRHSASRNWVLWWAQQSCSCASPQSLVLLDLWHAQWLWTLTASPAVPGSGRSSAVITSQGTQYCPGEGWLLPNALTLKFNQGGNHLCGTVTKLNILSIHTILRPHFSPKRDNPAL